MGSSFQWSVPPEAPFPRKAGALPARGDARRASKAGLAGDVLAHGWSLLDATAREVDRTTEPSELLDPPGDAHLLARTEQLMILTAGLALYHDVERRRLADSMRLGVVDGGFELLRRGSLGVSDPFEGRKHTVETSGAAKRSPRWPAPSDPDR